MEGGDNTKSIDVTHVNTSFNVEPLIKKSVSPNDIEFSVLKPKQNENDQNVGKSEELAEMVKL